MDELRQKTIKELAELIIGDQIVTASEFMTVPGNTIEGYVQGLLDYFANTDDMNIEETELLKGYLIEAAKKEIETNR